MGQTKHIRAPENSVRVSDPLKLKSVNIYFDIDLIYRVACSHWKGAVFESH